MSKNKIKFPIKSVSSQNFSPVKIPITTERFVVFLDIMGFKDRVARNPHHEILSVLQKLSSFISENIKQGEGLMFTMFSDSIIILSSDKTEETFKQIVNIASKVVEKAIEIGLPIKGAIACGECTVISSNKPLYFGQNIIDAYVLEESIEIYGVALHNTVEKFAVDMAKESNQIFDYKVKLKKSTSSHYVVSWFANDITRSEHNLLEIRKTVSDSPRRYIDYTLDCINAYKNAVE